MIDKIVVGSRISALRKSLGYSQAVFAEKLDVSTQAVSKWETGLALPDIETLLNISWICKISINSILEGGEFAGEYAGAGIDRTFFKLNQLLVCPKCRKLLKLNYQTPGEFELFYSCENGCKYYVKDGVADFGTREIPGEQWSLSFRNYDEYLHEHHWQTNPNYDRGLDSHEERWKIINKLKPRIILDVACGTGQGIKHIIKRINWPVTIIMADLSHRILKWDRIFYSDEWKNPYVDMIYLACDCANLPLIDECIDVVWSLGGFEGMQAKMMAGFKEGHRVLKPNGSTVYGISVVDDHESENTKKWVKLSENIDDNDDSALMEKMVDINQWLERCRQYGYSKNETIKIYGELPAPDTDKFPFDHEILQWMADYLVVSQK
ncbi:MAG: methyltransferase domain-containing protein [Oscillospiraceae bacterium]|nr:methyltransferase domain-containing protein [Oscillospiraceae bacterium]